MLLTTLCTNDEVYFYKKSIVVSFHANRKVLSTSPHNGGYREDITHAFNHDCTVGAGIGVTMLAPTYAEHMALLSEKLGLNPHTTAGISTAAQMENLSIKSNSYKDITVTALVTGGVEVNGGRVGDPASWDELEEKPIEHASHGTINIILHLNVDVTPGALARILVTCTEAKTAALQELLAPSRYSIGLATGSGTDGTIIVANADSKICLTDAGKHSKLGELIGKTVKDAVKEALYLQTGLSPTSQHNVLKRVDRFGITEDVLWERYRECANDGLDRARFSNRLYHLLRQDMLVTYTSLYAHLIDQLMWELLSPGDVLHAAGNVLNAMNMPSLQSQTHATDAVACEHAMVDALIRGLVTLLSTGDCTHDTAEPKMEEVGEPDDSL